jgi:hypothetical protein
MEYSRKLKPVMLPPGGLGSPSELIEFHSIQCERSKHAVELLAPSKGFVFQWGLPLRFTMQRKWIALGLFVAGLGLILGAGIPQLKHVAIGLAASLL